MTSEDQRHSDGDEATSGGRQRTRPGSDREAQPEDTGEVQSARADVERLEHDHHGAEDSTATNPGRTQSASPTPETSDGADGAGVSDD